MDDAVPITPPASGGTAYGEYPEPGRRALITLGVVLTTLMTSIDGTIANTVLPQIRASVSASQDEILWVLTSFILASTIVTPAIGWMERRFGRRNLLLGALVGFTVSSVLCGIATGIAELVLYRVLQGATAAVFIPLSQAILLDINPPKDHARAMALWGMGAVLGPIIGPILGGFLTDQLNWRWVFFINIPIAIVGFLIMAATLPKRVRREQQKFDAFGFIALVIGLVGMQMVLDRGPGAEWFSSAEIWIYAAFAVLGLYVFFVHIFTSERPIIHPSILADRNYLLSSVMGLLIGVLMFAGMAVLPSLMQGLLGYPVLTAGLTQASRGVGTFVSMFLVGQLVRQGRQPCDHLRRHKPDRAFLFPHVRLLARHGPDADHRLGLVPGSWPRTCLRAADGHRVHDDPTGPAYGSSVLLHADPQCGLEPGHFHRRRVADLQCAYRELAAV
jgi:DHA2 family multidrug resistance protein